MATAVPPILLHHRPTTPKHGKRPMALAVLVMLGILAMLLNNKNKTSVQHPASHVSSRAERIQQAQQYYQQLRTQSHYGNGSTTPETPPPPHLPKVAFYMTTHLSQQHVDFLTYCWPQLTQRLTLLQQSDLILYVSHSSTSLPLTSRLLMNLKFHRIIVKYKPQDDREDVVQQKQQGAMQALRDPFRPAHRWFDPYDWIVRLNPDVLLRNDTWFRQAMRNATATVLYVECDGLEPAPVVHTDFSVFRPSALNQTQLLQSHYNAEEHYSLVVLDELHHGRALKIPGAKAYHTFCRVMGPQSPVVHVHDDQILAACKAHTILDFHGPVVVDAERLPPDVLGEV